MKKRSLKVESDVLPMTTQLHSILENDLSWKFYFYLEITLRIFQGFYSKTLASVRWPFLKQQM